MLAAKVLPGVDVTVGHEEEEGGKWPYAGTTQAITALGAKHTVKEVTISYLNSLVSSRLVSSRLVSSRLFSSLLFSSLLFSSLLFSSLLFLKSQDYKTIN